MYQKISKPRYSITRRCCTKMTASYRLIIPISLAHSSWKHVRLYLATSKVQWWNCCTMPIFYVVLYLFCTMNVLCWYIWIFFLTVPTGFFSCIWTNLLSHSWYVLASSDSKFAKNSINIHLWYSILFNTLAYYEISNVKLQTPVA